MKVLICLFAIFAVSNAGILKLLNIGIGGGLIGGGDYSNSGYSSSGYSSGGYGENYGAAPVQSVQYVQSAPVKVVQVVRQQPIVYQAVSAPVYQQSASNYQSAPASSYGSGYGSGSGYSASYNIGFDGLNKFISIFKGGW